MNRETQCGPSNGILFSHKKDGDSDTCYNMAEPWGHDVSEIVLSHDGKCIIPLIKGT